MYKTRILTTVFFIISFLSCFPAISQNIDNTASQYKKSGEYYYIVNDRDTGLNVIVYTTKNRGVILEPFEITGILFVDSNGKPTENYNSSSLLLSALICYSGTTKSSTIYSSQASYWKDLYDSSYYGEKKFNDAISIGTFVTLIKTTDEFCAFLTPGKGKALDKLMNSLRSAMSAAANKMSLSASNLLSFKDKCIKQKKLLTDIKNNSYLLYTSWRTLSFNSGQSSFAKIILYGKKGEGESPFDAIINDYRYFLLNEEGKLLLAGFSPNSGEIRELKTSYEKLNDIASNDRYEKRKIESLYNKMMEIKNQRIKTKISEAVFKIENYIPSGFILKEVVEIDTDSDKSKEKFVHCKSNSEDLFFILKKDVGMWKKFPVGALSRDCADYCIVKNLYDNALGSPGCGIPADTTALIMGMRKPSTSVFALPYKWTGSGYVPCER